jgi:hypothetical protein
MSRWGWFSARGARDCAAEPRPQHRWHTEDSRGRSRDGVDSRRRYVRESVFQFRQSLAERDEADHQLDRLRFAAYDACSHAKRFHWFGVHRAAAWSLSRPCRLVQCIFPSRRGCDQSPALAVLPSRRIGTSMDMRRLLVATLALCLCVASSTTWAQEAIPDDAPFATADTVQTDAVVQLETDTDFAPIVDSEVNVSQPAATSLEPTDSRRTHVRAATASVTARADTKAPATLPALQPTAPFQPLSSVRQPAPNSPTREARRNATVTPTPALITVDATRCGCVTRALVPSVGPSVAQAPALRIQSQRCDPRPPVSISVDREQFKPRRIAP